MLSKLLSPLLCSRPQIAFTRQGEGWAVDPSLWLVPGHLHPREPQIQPFPGVNMLDCSSRKPRSHSRSLLLPVLHLLNPELSPLPNPCPPSPSPMRTITTLSPHEPDWKSDRVSPLFQIQQFPIHFKSKTQTSELEAPGESTFTGSYSTAE